MTAYACAILPGDAVGPVVDCVEALSFWGGVDPLTGVIIDAYHPMHGVCISGSVLMMPTSRGSCTGSGVLLDLILNCRAPAALLFLEQEDVLTLGALVAYEMFGKTLPIVRLNAAAYAELSKVDDVLISASEIKAGSLIVPVEQASAGTLQLSASDRTILSGASGSAAAQAMRIICAMALQQGATSLISVSQVHVDGCIYASPANLNFAERMAELGARVTVPTSMNAISVDHAHWRAQGVPASFGYPAQRLADAYVRMGCRPSFTCAPYLLETAPSAGEDIAWSESNAVIYANSVLGARTTKHPDFLDLCVALTGRAPHSGVYIAENRRPHVIIDVALPDNPEDAFWPLAGYLAGRLAKDRIPLLRGLKSGSPTTDDLKALCAAFGTTAAAPMLHMEGVTPEADAPVIEGAEVLAISFDDLRSAWQILNGGPTKIDLVAIGSPHASLGECHALADALADGGRVTVPLIVTAGRDVIAKAGADDTLTRLTAAGVQLIPDLCWCSISEPVFPPHAAAVMTNSGKYAHYGPGLTGRQVRFGSLRDCVEAALTGQVEPRLPGWLSKEA